MQSPVSKVLSSHRILLLWPKFAKGLRAPTPLASCRLGTHWKQRRLTLKWDIHKVYELSWRFSVHTSSRVFECELISHHHPRATATSSGYLCLPPEAISACRDLPNPVRSRNNEVWTGSAPLGTYQQFPCSHSADGNPISGVEDIILCCQCEEPSLLSWITWGVRWCWG